MKINFNLEETVNGTSYKVSIESPDGEAFWVRENNKKVTLYETREDFLEEFPELASWFWPEEEDKE